ncbi:MAG: hypothetical protein L6R41_004168 [Letrouitia leprolyta]|nr:MAG: hypothetical protein L6R41_004168 [Letrouitia leprolyta]
MPNQGLSGSSSSSSSTTNHSYTSSSVSRQSGTVPRKRKRRASEEIALRISNPKRYYSTKYHSLFNKAVEDLQPEIHASADENGLKTSQIGISTWSPHEKGEFFRGIARHGRNNLPAVAGLIKTKTELEVHVYLRALQEASKKQHKYGERRWLIGPADIAPAVEISDPCCASLEEAADAMALFQQRYEERHEKQKHADLWILDQKVAQWANRRLSEGEEGRIEISKSLPAAETLDLSHFLKLSTNIFMNSNDPHNNYRSFVSRSGKPSMLYTAFADLYALVLSITKRIIQSSLFFAMSRLRATQSSHYAHQQAVRQADVFAALRVLGMKHSVKDYWIHVPRRCKLDVHNQANARSAGKALDYDEVERALTHAKSTVGQNFDATESKEDCNASPRPPEQLDSELESTSIESSSIDIDRTEDSPTQSGLETDFSVPGERFNERVDMYLEHVDQKESEKEELRLWKMLNRSPPTDIPAQEPPVEIGNPGPYRKDKADMDDWRNRANVRPEWDICDIDGLDKDLAENRKQMRIHSWKSARPDVRRRGTQSKHNEKQSPALRQSKNAHHDTVSASDHRSTSHRAAPMGEVSKGAISPLNEEDSDAMSDYLDDEHSQELGKDFGDAVADHHDLLQLPEEENQVPVDNDGSRTMGSQRPGPRTDGISSSNNEEESESESESGREDRNDKGLTDSSDDGSDSIED